MPPVPRRPSLVLVAGMLALLCAAVGVLATYEDTTTQRRAADPTGAWVTSPVDPARRLLRLDAGEPGVTTARVRVDPEDRRQVWRGTGAAMTDASVELLGLAPDGLRRLFDPDADDGAQLGWVRLPLTATDMSPRAWTWGWDGTTASPSPQARTALAVLAKVQALQPRVQVVATPWTAPPWMKQPATVRGGALREDAVDQYAAMLVAQVDALRRADVPLTSVTLGNEPGHAGDHPSMTMSTSQQSELGRQVGPQLHDRGLELWAVDGDWTDRPRHDEVLVAAPDAFDAAAFHCGAGAPGEMAGVGVPPVVTECAGTRDTWRTTFAWDAEHLLAGSIAAGSTGLVMWNLATDPEGGPRDLASRAACSDCRGLLTVDGSRASAGPEFFVLAHLARAAEPGARVLGSRSSGHLPSAAFLNPDGTVGVVAFNDTDEDRVVGVAVPGRAEVRRRVEAGELLTVRIRR